MKTKVKIVIDAVCDHYGLEYETLKTYTRKREISTARMMACYLIMENVSVSQQKCGNYFGGRDRTTVVHALNRIDELVETSEDVRESLLELRDIIYDTINKHEEQKQLTGGVGNDNTATD